MQNCTAHVKASGLIWQSCICKSVFRRPPGRDWRSSYSRAQFSAGTAVSVPRAPLTGSGGHSFPWGNRWANFLPPGFLAVTALTAPLQLDRKEPSAQVCHLVPKRSFLQDVSLCKKCSLYWGVIDRVTRYLKRTSWWFDPCLRCEWSPRSDS